MVGNAGVIEAEVVLISKKSQDDTLRWVYLDSQIQRPRETTDEMIRYPIRTEFDGDGRRPLRNRRTKLRFDRRALREGAGCASRESGDRRQV